MKYVVLGFVLCFAGFLQAAPIPGLFNTGVDGSGNVLSPGATDSHYVLARSADRVNPGPTVYVVAPAATWVPNTDKAAWVGVSANSLGDFGYFVFRAYLDLSELDPSTAVITGRRSVDNVMVEIRLNGASTGNPATGGFDVWTDFTIASGFIPGTNVLDFVVHNGFGSVDVNLPSHGDPLGFIAEMTGSAEPLPGKKIPIRTIFGTGLDAQGLALPPGGVDPHYKLVANPDTVFSGTNAVVTDAHPDWIASGGPTRWISNAQHQSTVGSMAGDYVYETTFDLTGFNLEKITVKGRWAADNVGKSITLNGTSIGSIADGFAQWADFELKQGLVAGKNVLRFTVENAGGPNPNPGGLRVDFDAYEFIPRDDTPPRLSITPERHLTLTGPVNRTYSILYQDTLEPQGQWELLADITLTEAQQTFEDSAPESATGRRFYRAVMLP